MEGFIPNEDMAWNHDGAKDHRGRPRKSRYKKGAQYRITNQVLRRKVMKWAGEGKVRMVNLPDREAGGSIGVS